MEGRVLFGVADYIVLALTLVISVGIGFLLVFFGKKQNSQVEYLLGGRSLGVIPVCMSVFATFTSAISLLGWPADVYSYGTMLSYFILSSVAGNLIMMVTLLPLIYPLKITSINEYLQMRFESRAVRLIGAAMGMATNISYMTIALLSPAIALQTVADLPLWMSLVLLGAIGTIYTVMGGIRSVVWTDTFQTVIILAGSIVTLIKACTVVGDFNSVLKRTEERGRIRFLDFDPDPRVRHTVWGIGFGVTLYATSFQFGQAYCQRISSTRSPRDSKLAILCTIPIILLYGILLIFTGLVIFAYFDFHGCDPLAAGYIQSNNQLVPYFVMHVLAFAPGLAGFYISTVFAGALSTLSSGINSLAANTVEDLLERYTRRYEDSTKTTISKCVAAIYGAGIIGLAFIAKEIKGPLTQIVFKFKGITGGPCFGLFCLGAMFPQTNKVGAIAGVISGLSISLWLIIGNMMYGMHTPALPAGPTYSCQDFHNDTDINEFIRNNNGTTSSTNYTITQLNVTSTMVPPGSVSSDKYLTTFLTSTPEPQNNIWEDRGFSLYDISYVWPPFIAWLVTICVGLITSIIVEKVNGSKKRTKPEYLFPFMRVIWFGKTQSVTSYQNREEETKFIEDTLTTKMPRTYVVSDT